MTGRNQNEKRASISSRQIYAFSTRPILVLFSETTKSLRWRQVMNGKKVKSVIIWVNIGRNSRWRRWGHFTYLDIRLILSRIWKLFWKWWSWPNRQRFIRIRSRTNIWYRHFGVWDIPFVGFNCADGTIGGGGGGATGLLLIPGLSVPYKRHDKYMI